MGLSASMWTSVSGLLAHGNKMNVVGNNIANVSTIGFKGQRMDFNDYLYLNGGSTSGPTQIGAGVATYAVLGDFSQGSLESTNSVTDIAIDGEGFFRVRKPNTDQMYYTRAGDFYFNAERQLQNPEGYRLQGWRVDNSTRLTFKSDSVNLGENPSNESAFVGTGTPRDIVLDSWYLEPQRTSSVSFTMGLSSSKDNDRSVGAKNPMSALWDAWDASKKPPLAESAYPTSSPIKVYDEGGNPHELTVYYDQVASKTDSYEIKGLPAGYTIYEYIVTIKPEEDMRQFGGTGYDRETNTFANEGKNFYDSDPEVCNKKAGLLMTGHLIFDAAGNLMQQTAYTYGGTEEPGVGDQVGEDVDGRRPDDLAMWQPTRFSSNGLPVFTANFTGQPLANSVNEMMPAVGSDEGISQAQDYIIELDLGLRNLGGKDGNNWTVEGKSLADLEVTGGTEATTTYEVVTAGADGKYPDNCFYTTDNPPTDASTWTALPAPTEDPGNAGMFIYTLPAGAQVRRRVTTDATPGTITYNEIPMFADKYRTENATSAGTKSFVTQDASQNGYASGVLSGTNITNDGVVYGYYDNGETVPLYQIALYDFHNKQGLRREGGNLYAQTKESGEPRQGVAGDNGFGVTRAYNIEQSNVDLSREFVNMITTQRGFQANSKGITTVDTMLETVIGMKR